MGFKNALMESERSVEGLAWKCRKGDSTGVAMAHLFTLRTIDPVGVLAGCHGEASGESQGKHRTQDCSYGKHVTTDQLNINAPPSHPTDHL